MSVAEFICLGDSLAEALLGRFFFPKQEAALFLMSAQLHQDRVILGSLLRFLYGLSVAAEELLAGSSDAFDKELADFFAVRKL